MRTVNIQPGVSVLSALKLLNYQAHYALAEFIDNSIDSYLKNRAILNEKKHNYKLKVNIDFNRSDGTIKIRDNAAGISWNDYQRAFRTAHVPADTSGLSEFGMGMKSAACWFSQEWSVISKFINEDVERTVRFNISKIVEDNINELDIEEATVLDGSYTTVILHNLHNAMPNGTALGKIKSHLTSIYRDFIRENEMELYYNGELLTYQQPNILKAPYYNSNHEPEGPSKEWMQEIDFPVDENLHVSGMIGILEKGSNSKAGLSLFRRRRVIVGSSENKYKPEIIFGKGNSFASQRLFGELHLTGFQVTHTKDGFKEGENMELFLEHLKEQLDKAKEPLLKQVQNFRKVPNTAEQSRKYGKLLKKTVSDFSNSLTDAVEQAKTTTKQEDIFEEIETSRKSNYEEIVLPFKNMDWLVCIELSYDEGIHEWIEIGDNFIRNKENREMSIRKIGIRLAMKHRFMVEYGIMKNDSMTAIIRIAAVIGLSEVLAKNSGLTHMRTHRKIMNLLFSKIK